MTKQTILPAKDPHLTHPNYRPDIDGLRALAVLAVVGFHAFPDWVRGGMIGVDIFFVISGFLISTIIFGSLERGDFSFKAFYVRRIRRIFPALLTVMTACFVFGWFALLADEYKQLGKHIAAGAGFVSNFALWSESGYFDNDSMTKPLLHLWSLGIEEQFYIVWPFLLWASWKKKVSLLKTTAVIAVASFGVNIWQHRIDMVADFYSPLTRFWELLVGAGLAYANLRGMALPKKIKISPNALSFLGLALIVAGLLLIKKSSFFPGFWALLPTFGAAFVISAGAKAWFNRTVLSSRPMVFFGLISFPLYLWHWPLLSFAHIVESETPVRSVRIAAVLFSILLAWLTCAFIEKPLRFGPNGKRKAIGLLAAMLLVGSAGFAVYQKDGLESRSSIREYKNNKNELVRTPATDDVCKAYIGEAAPLFVYCKMTDVGARETVAVIGDSHAHVAYPGIADLMKERGVNTVLLANSGCPPFIGAEHGKSEKEKLECKEQITAMLAAVSAKKDIRKVFIFSRGPVYLTGNGFGDAEKGTKGPPLIPPALFLASLQASVDRLSKAGKNVFYVAENPELGVYPTACIGRPLREKPKDCSIGIETVLERQKEYLDLLKGIKNAPIIQTLPVFCPEGVCKAFDGTALLYADDDHLSITGSRFQAEKILAPYLITDY